MKDKKNDKFKSSLKCAVRGLKYVLRNERNFRIELIVAIFVIFSSIIFRIKNWEFIVVIFLITWVLVTELMNTVVERVVDILEPRVHPFARLIKDIMAGVVLTSAIMSFLVGLFIFLPHIYNLLNLYF
ncbi:MAG: diacylglycerol kinase [Candidatus Moranbacteria bacterium]|jgi:diacylglycerol kinase|nr:diacylglycerol kinase [Candidatus Moranbacteria bacterium]